MTIIKSLKKNVDKNGSGHYHRTHRAKKNRKERKKTDTKSLRLKKILRYDGKLV